MEAHLRPVLARQMEIYAAFLEHTDYHVGRIIDVLADLEIVDDTLIYYIIGDNGASAEGTLIGCCSEWMVNEGPDLNTPELLIERMDDLGTPKAYNHYAVGWAHAMDTPYQWTKQIASHWGGTRNGTIVHWPRGFKAKGEVRHQFEVGCDLGEPVSEDYGARGNEFNGKINWVQIDIDAAAKDVDHKIGAEERFRFAMTRQ